MYLAIDSLIENNMEKEMTFASMASKIKNRYAKGLERNDPFSVKSFNKEMDRLIQEQEDYKAKNELMGDNTTFATGGGLNAKVSAERNRRGKDMSMAEVEAFLGKDFADWKAWAEPSLAKTRGANEKNADFNSMVYGDRFANLKDDPEANTVESHEPQDRSFITNPNFVPYKTNPMYDIASTGLSVAGQLARDKASPVNFDRVGANYVDYDPARRDIKRQIDETRIDALSGIRGAGGTRSQQLRAMQGLNTQLSANEARALNESYMQQYNQNAGIRSQADAMNADISAREKMQNYNDKRYVTEANNFRNTEIANTLSALPQRLKLNSTRDMLFNTSANDYGFDKDGNVINKQIPVRVPMDDSMRKLPMPTNPLQDATYMPRVKGLSQAPVVLPKGDYRISPEDAMYDNEDATLFSKGGKIKKYKCGGKLRKK